MNNYYQQIRVSPSASQKEIEKAIKTRWNEIKKMKLSCKQKEKFKIQLEHIRSVLTDYHKRREYDDFYHYFHFYDSGFLNVNEMSPLPLGSLRETPNPILSNNLQSQSFSMTQSYDSNGSVIYTHNYQNNNGKEEEYNEKITINRDGRKIVERLPNRYLDL
jgi:curved DNA-binding protein CbpA